MTAPLTDLQKRLCNRLQRGLPLVSQPFAQMATDLGCTEADVLDQMRQLQADGVLRRICAVLNQRALGMASTLVATRDVCPADFRPKPNHLGNDICWPIRTTPSTHSTAMPVTR